MKPGSQSVLDLVEAHLNDNLPTELEAFSTTIDDSLILQSPFDKGPCRTWSKRLIVDPVRLPVSEVRVKMSAILGRLPVTHEILSVSTDRSDVLALSALAERGSQRCVINITYIQATERLFVHLIVATGVPWSAPMQR